MAELITEKHEVSAGVIAETITKRMAKEFKCSRPRPRNRAMGFRGTDLTIKKRHG